MRTRPHHPGPFLMAIAMLTAAGCGPASPTATPEATMVAETSRRLEGDWKLLRFVPEQALSSALQAMLEFQYQALTIHVGGGRITAESPGVFFDRPYEIVSSNGDSFRLVSYDDGVPSESWGQFEPDGTHLSVRNVSPPWRGTATLARVGPPR